MKRRDFMRAASGVAGGTAVAATGSAAVAGTATAQEEEPDWGGWLDDAPNYTRTQDLRGETEVEVAVGTGPEGVEFEPPAIWIDPGTTVVWEWTGEGGAHDVTTEEGPADLSSDLTDEAGFTYEFTFEAEHEGITTYYCSPHIGVGMLGGVAVGDDVPTVAVDDVVAVDPHDMGVAIREHYVGVGAILMLAVTNVFAFYVLKYGESPHAGHGGDQ